VCEASPCTAHFKQCLKQYGKACVNEATFPNSISTSKSFRNFKQPRLTTNVSSSYEHHCKSPLKNYEKDMQQIEQLGRRDYTLLKQRFVEKRLTTKTLSSTNHYKFCTGLCCIINYLNISKMACVHSNHHINHLICVQSIFVHLFPCLHSKTSTTVQWRTHL